MKKVLLIGVFVLALVGFIKVDTNQQGKWVAPASAKEITNPVSSKNKNSSAKKGRKLFTQYCIVCHGKMGKGDGVGGKTLNPKPANLTSDAVQKQVDGEIFWKISNGRNAMIKWGPIISENDRWALVNYVRTLK